MTWEIGKLLPRDLNLRYALTLQHVITTTNDNPPSADTDLITLPRKSLPLPLLLPLMSTIPHYRVQQHINGSQW